LPPQQLQKVTGLIERITFHSAETGFAVLRLKVKGHRDLVTVVGVLPSVNAGEWLEAIGRWIVDREHGQQFKAEILKTSHPNTIEGIKRFLGSGLIKGIGPHFAEQLVEKFGLQVFEIIERAPKRLLEVNGIGEKRYVKIKTAWKEQKAIREIMVFMHTHGVGTSRAFRIYKTYGDESIEKIQNNPYQLASDVWGIGFKTADQIAESLGIEKHSDIRARAGTEFVMQELTDEGHCAYPRDQLVKRAQKILDIPLEIIERALDFAISEDRLVEHDYKEQNLIYLSSIDASEKLLAKNLIKLSKGKHPFPSVNIVKVIHWVETKLSIDLGNAQKKALEQVVKSKVVVITGGPGVGKTTLVNAIIKIFHAKKLRTVLCAPTGRAAKRMSEATQTTAKTIHRLLEFDPSTMGFKHNAKKPLKGDVFIVDETSMIDLVLAHQLIRSIPVDAALIFVGDVDQLPSVGPGTVLGDIINSGTLQVCRLTEVFRQAAQSSIITNAHLVNAGEKPRWPRGKVTSPENNDFYFVEADEVGKAVGLILKLIKDNIPKQFNLNPIEDIQLLTPMQRGELGARNLNVVLQEALNPTGDFVERFGWIFRVGDKVMQIVNNYDLDVFNGDIGRILLLDHEDKIARIQFDGRTVDYDFDALDEIILSYAITIHKSQGSEYPCVIIPIHTQHYMLLQRNLLYTAITRGKHLVVIVGSVKALAIAVKKMEAMRRVTTLCERLIEHKLGHEIVR